MVPDDPNDRERDEDDDPNADERGYASPPCFLHELDPEYLGYMSPSETRDFLNTLLEAERAGAQVAHALARKAREEGLCGGAAEELRAALTDVGHDEADFCAMLTRHLRRLGHTPSRAVGDFREKVLGLEDLGRQLDLLDRGQRWVARKLAEALPRIHDDDLHGDLEHMRIVHERNLARCAGLSR